MQIIKQELQERRLLKKFDVVVVGAGTGGCLAAKTIAEAGFDVCLMDRKKEQDIGEKVCGDAIGKHHFDNLKLDYPAGEELERKITGIKVYSPNMETAVDIRGEGLHGFIVNRRLFGQRLLKKAIEAGATFLESTQAVEPIIKDRFVTGVLAKNVETGNSFSVFGQVVVDASGFMAVVRHKLPPEMSIEREVANEDVEACYREIRQLKQETENTKYCEIYLNQKVTPAGYTWIFPKRGAKVNAGLGICMRGKFPNPKKQFYKHILAKPLFEGSLLLTGGSWYDPTRRPLDNMVGNGVAILGDAACLVNPIHGGGIGPSMLSGYLAGETIK